MSKNTKKSSDVYLDMLHAHKVYDLDSICSIMTWIAFVVLCSSEFSIYELWEHCIV
jgi:hypothetical protein